MPVGITRREAQAGVRCTRSHNGRIGLLNDAGIEFEELLLNRDYTDQTLRAVSSRITYPQVFIDGKHIGGAEDLAKWLDDRHGDARNAA